MTVSLTAEISFSFISVTNILSYYLAVFHHLYLTFLTPPYINHQHLSATISLTACCDVLNELTHLFPSLGFIFLSVCMLPHVKSKWTHLFWGFVSFTQMCKSALQKKKKLHSELFGNGTLSGFQILPASFSFISQCEPAHILNDCLHPSGLSYVHHTVGDGRLK